MDTMVMPEGCPLSMAFMPLCGQSRIAAAASFLTMWTVMMVSMMLPSSVPALWRYHQSLGGVGELPRAAATALASFGYSLVWISLGAAVYPLGVILTAVTTRYPLLGRIAPIAAGLIVLIAGALQLTRWKARHLACCRDSHAHGLLRQGRPSHPGPLAAVRHGLRLGLHCCQCCAGLTAVLLVSGMMDLPVMIAVTAGITLERLAPAGERVARGIGVIAVGAGVLLIARAIAHSQRAG